MATYTVMDISKYNTVTDYTSAAAAINGVLIRIGYRGYGSSGTLVKDPLFDTHYSSFSGKTKVGIYWFTQAITTAEAVAEANYVYSLLGSNPVDFPIYIDSEYSNTSHNGRADSLSKADRTTITIAFCERIKELGYRAGVYASDSWYNSNLDLSQLQEKGYSIWVAKYSTSAPTYTTNYDGWQYTSSGSISGVTGNCDLSIFYNDVAGWVTTKPDISTYTLNVPTNIFEYTGSEIKPSFGIGALVAGTDYTYQYSNNINAGIGTCTITGVNNYQGIVTFNFTINPKDISSESVTLNGYSFTYTGLAIEPQVTDVTGNPTYTVSYENNVNVGTGIVNVTGNGNYTETISSKFSITQKSLELYTISLPYEAYAYTGSEIKPVVTIDNLVEGIDFSTEYFNNIDLGTATVTCKGRGNYLGSISTNFRISNTVIDITKQTVTMSYTTTVYNREYQCPDIVVGSLIEGTDYTLDIVNNLNIGEATIKIIGINDYTGTIVKTFTITAQNINEYVIELPQSSYSYTGSSIKPKVTISNLVEGIDFDVEYGNNINVGNGSITATAKGNYIGVLSVSFPITQSDVLDIEASLDNYTFIYDGTYKTPKVIVKDLIEGSDYYIKYYNNINAGTDASVVIFGLGNYSGSKEIYFTIARQSISSRTLVIDDGTEFYYNTQYITPKAHIDDLRLGTDYELNYYSNSAVGTAEIIANGINNYQGSIIEYFSIITKPINLCYAKYGYASIKTIYRIEDGLGLRIYTDSTETYQLTEYMDYEVKSHTSKEIDDTFTLHEFVVKGFGGFSDEATFRFRTIPTEPSEPIDQEDDGVYNFGDIDLEDETAEGDYDFGDLDEGVSEESIAEGDYDFDALSGMYLDKYDEDDGSNIDDKGSDEKDPEPKQDDDDGVYNFGDIDLEDETAEGDYDFGDLDEGVDDDTVAKGDYDFNNLAGDTEEWLAAGTEFKLDNTPMFVTYSSPTSFDNKSGNYYVYNSSIVNGRIRMARTDGAVEMPGRACGWCRIADLLNLGNITVGTQLNVDGKLALYANGTGGWIEDHLPIMYVKEILDTSQYDYPYAMSSGPKTARIGFASEEMLSKVEDV